MLTEEQINFVKKLGVEKAGKEGVFVYGNFNIIHPGHLRLLNFARTCGDYLVVGLSGDDDQNVYVPYELRSESLHSLEAVDFVIKVAPKQISDLIRALKPKAVVKGKEHENDINPEREVLKEIGGHLIFSGGEAKFSTLDLLRKEMLTPADFVMHRDEAFLERHETSSRKINEIIDKFDKLRVLVIGDLIVDEYIYCDPLGMSQEDPTIVVTPVQTKTFVGGAGIVAGHIAGLGAATSFLSVVGDDQTAEAAKVELKKFGVNCRLLIDSSRPTTLKQRYRVQNKTMLRVSHLRSHDIGEEYINELIEHFKSFLPDLDLVVFSDFNYGALPQKLVDSISSSCKKAGVPYIADSQASSQVGDISRYKGAELASSTEREARLALNDFKSGLQNIANNLFQKLSGEKLFVKLGAEGMLIMSSDKGLTIDSLSAMNSNPIDVAGAGDAMLAASGLALSAGASVWECAYLGSLASAIQVSRVGNVPLKRDALKAELK